METLSLIEIIGIILLIYAAVLIVIRPYAGLILIIALSACNFGLNEHMDFQFTYKVLLSLCLVSALVRGRRTKGWANTLAKLIVFGTYALFVAAVKVNDGYTMNDALMAYLNFGVGIMVLFVDWSRSKYRVPALYMLTLMAPISLLIAIIQNRALYIGGTIVTSSVRAWVAFFPCLAVLAILQLRRVTNKYHVFLLIANAAVVLLSNQRMPFLVFCLVLIPYLRDVTKQLTKNVMLAILILAPVAVFVGGVSVVKMLERTFDLSTTINTDAVLNTSNRQYAWAQLWEACEGQRFVGLGIGSIKTLNSFFTKLGFVSPHNEYLKYIYETGYIGLAQVFLIIAGAYRRIFERTTDKFAMAVFFAAYAVFAFFDNPLSAMQIFAPTSLVLSLYNNANNSANQLPKGKIVGKPSW